MIDIIKQYSREALTMLRVAGLYAAQIATAAWTWAMVNPMIASLITSVAIVAFGLYYLRHKTEKGSKGERVENTSTDYSTTIARQTTEIARLSRYADFFFEATLNTQRMIQPQAAPGLDARVVVFDYKSTEEYLKKCGIYQATDDGAPRNFLGYLSNFNIGSENPMPSIPTIAHQEGQSELSPEVVRDFISEARITPASNPDFWENILTQVNSTVAHDHSKLELLRTVTNHCLGLDGKLTVEQGGDEIERNPAQNITLKSFWLTVQSLATQPITFFRLVGDERDWKMLAYRMRNYTGGNSTQLAEIANLMKSCLAQFKPNEPEYEMAQVIRNAATEKKFHEGKGDLQRMVSTEHEGAKFEMIDQYFQPVESLPDQLIARQQSQPS